MDPAATTPSATSGGTAASGEPLKVLVTGIADSPLGDHPGIWAGAELAARNINEAGGIKGRPIEVVKCNGKGDPRAELACARQGVSEGVIASDSNVFAVNPQGAYEILDRGRVADVAGAGGAPAAYTLPNMFPIEYLPATALGCVSPDVVNSAGSDVKVAAAVAENPFAQGVFELVEPYLKAAPELKGRYVGSESVPATQQDMSPIVQRLSDKGANFIQVNLPSTTSAQLVSAAAAAGKQWTFCVDGSLLDDATYAQLAPSAKSLLTVSTLPLASSDDAAPLLKRFQQEVEAADGGGAEGEVDVNDLQVLRSWLGMQVIKQVAEGIDGEVTTKSFFDAINAATAVDLGYTKVDFTKPLGRPPFERVFQPTAFVSKWNVDEKALDEVAQVNLLELHP